MLIYKASAVGKMSFGKVCTIRFASNKLDFTNYETAHFTIFTERKTTKNVKYSYTSEFSFDRFFYDTTKKLKRRVLTSNGINLLVTFRSVGEQDNWEIMFPSEKFKGKSFSFSTGHIEIKTTETNKSKCLQTKVVKISVPSKNKKDNYFNVPEESAHLYNSGFLFRLPNEKPQPLGRSTNKNSGGSKTINAKYIGKMNQGGRFTPK